MTISIRLLTASIGLAAMLASGPAMADAVNTTECRRDLAAANRHIEAIRTREKRFVAGNLARNCPLLRQNLADMVAAREPMDRCLKGHEQGETVAQIDASIEDIRDVLAGNCPD
jgi:hypothetical protein